MSGGRVAPVPSRLGGVLKFAVIFGYISFENSFERYVACASVITFRTPSLRQSPVGKLSVFETQTSVRELTARSVNVSARRPPVTKLISGQTFVEPTGGLSNSSAASTAAAASGAACGSSPFLGFFTFTSLPTWMTSPLPFPLPPGAAGATVGTASASAATVRPTHARRSVRVFKGLSPSSSHASVADAISAARYCLVYLAASSRQRLSTRH